MKTLPCVALILLTSSCFLFCEDAGKPVPSDWIHEGRLVVPPYNFSVGSPNPNSQWSYLDLPSIQGFSTTGFVVSSSSNERFVVIVWETGSNIRLDDPANKKSFIDNMHSSLPKGWSAVGDPTIKPTDVPMTGSWKTKTAIRLPEDGGIVYAYQYAVIGKRTYMLITYSPDPTEPVAFSQFAASFAVLSSNALPPPPQNYSGIFILWALWGAIVDWRYIRRGGIKPNKNDKLGVLAAIGLCIAVIVFVGIRGASAESIGSMTGLFLTLIFSLWEFARWRIRRKNPLPKIPKGGF